MRKTKEVRMEWLAAMTVLTIFLILMMGLLGEGFSIISRAEGKGKVTATAAKIRKETDVNSEVLGSVPEGKVIDIKSEVKDSAGTVWYEVYVSGEVTGYIRSDLVEKTDGTAPSATTPDTPAVMNPTVEVTAVEPLAATITGSQAVRVRADASTNGSIIASVQTGAAVTVTGQATGTDGNTWYQVSYNADGTDVAGFVRSDYLTLSGEVVPAGQGAGEGGEGGGEQTPETGEPAQPSKDYDTQQQDGEWYLLDYGAGEQYKITDLITAAKVNFENYQNSLGTIKIQKIVIVVMVVLLVLAVLAATLLFFKIRDITDEAYFTAVEKETIRERSSGRGQGGKSPGASSKKVMQTLGSDKGTAGQSGPQIRPGAQRSQAAPGRNAGPQSQVRSSGSVKPSDSVQARTGAQSRSGAGTVQARPAAGTAQSRPAGAGQVQARPAAGTAQSRPAGAGQSRPTAAAGQTKSGGAGQTRPAGGAQPGAAMKSAAAGQGRSAGSAGGAAAARPAVQKTRPGQNQQDPGWKSKNFMTDDDEFEFEFLNWDEDEN